MRVRIAPAAVAAALLLAGCSQSVDGQAAPASSTSDALDGRTGQDLADAAADALEDAGSVHVSGTFDSDGEAGTGDLQLQGEDVAGSMSVLGSTVQVIITGGEVFMNAPADFWVGSGAPDDVVALIADIWVLVPVEAGLGVDDLSLASFADGLRDPEDGTIEDRVTDDELDGQPVWVLSTTAGDQMLVAAEGPSYPLQLTETGEDAGVTTLSGFGEIQLIEAPADYLDLSDVGA